jgi:hypothetical protein
VSIKISYLIIADYTNVIIYYLYRNNGVSNATLYDPTSKADVGKGLVQDGFIIVEKRPGRRFAKFVSLLNSQFISLVPQFKGRICIHQLLYDKFVQIVVDYFV